VLRVVREELPDELTHEQRIATARAMAEALVEACISRLVADPGSYCYVMTGASRMVLHGRNFASWEVVVQCLLKQWRSYILYQGRPATCVEIAAAFDQGLFWVSPQQPPLVQAGHANLVEELSQGGLLKEVEDAGLPRECCLFRGVGVGGNLAGNPSGFHVRAIVFGSEMFKPGNFAAVPPPGPSKLVSTALSIDDQLAVLELAPRVVEAELIAARNAKLAEQDQVAQASGRPTIFAAILVNPFGKRGPKVWRVDVRFGCIRLVWGSLALTRRGTAQLRGLEQDWGRCLVCAAVSKAQQEATMRMTRGVLSGDTSSRYYEVTELELREIQTAAERLPVLQAAAAAARVCELDVEEDEVELDAEDDDEADTGLDYVARDDESGDASQGSSFPVIGAASPALSSSSSSSASSSTTTASGVAARAPRRYERPVPCRRRRMSRPCPSLPARDVAAVPRSQGAQDGAARVGRAQR